MTRTEALSTVLAAYPACSVREIKRNKARGFFDVYWFATLSNGKRVWFEESERIVTLSE